MVKRLSKPLIIILSILLVLIALSIVWHLIRLQMIKSFFEKYKEPPAVVAAAVAKQADWQNVLTAVGTIKAVQSVSINAEVAGQITKINFKYGQLVKKGQSLIQLDDALDQQQLKNEAANLKFDQITYDRQKKLFATRAASRSSLDQALAKLQQSKANVAKAKINIEYKNIRAPFSGKLGIADVNLGEYVTPGKALVSLQALNPLYVDFNLPEQNLAKINVGEKIGVRVDAYPDEVVQGNVVAIDAQVNIDTRNILVRGLIPNKALKRYPGQFAHVTLYLPTRYVVTIVPRTAITYSLYGNTVYVLTPVKTSVKSKALKVSQTAKTAQIKKTKPSEITTARSSNKPSSNKPSANPSDQSPPQVWIATQKFVRLGEPRGEWVSILEGIKPGDRVVIAGQLKLRSGREVIINNSARQDQESPKSIQASSPNTHLAGTAQ